MARYRCTVCNWVYDEEQEGIPFNSLPDSYTLKKTHYQKLACPRKALFF
jgi:rubredoxin